MRAWTKIGIVTLAVMALVFLAIRIEPAGDDAEAARTHASRSAAKRLKSINDVLDEHDVVADNLYGPATWANGLATNNADAGTVAATYLTRVTITIGDGGADQTIVLGSGMAAGQRKKFMLSARSTALGAKANIAPTSTSGWTSATLYAKWSWIELEWNGSAWLITGHSGATIT